MNPSVMRVDYKEGEKVEVSINEKGFRGSYIEGVIVSCLQNGQYKVRYKNLLEDDESGPLIEEICSRDLRPLPPRVREPPEFQPNQKVDVFDKDGWWLGEITGKKIRYMPKKIQKTIVMRCILNLTKKQFTTIVMRCILNLTKKQFTTIAKELGFTMSGLMESGFCKLDSYDHMSIN